MTGFASAQGQTPLGFMTVELRSVNSRFLDLTLRPCDDLRSCEPLLREMIAAEVKRGKIECRASLKQTESSQTSINQAALSGLLALQEEIRKVVPEAKPLTVANILEMPGILTSPEVDQDELNAAVADVMRNALQAFTASREREGAALAAILSKNCDTIESVVNSVAEHIPEIHRNLKEKLEQRLQEALGTTLAESANITREDVSDRIRQDVVTQEMNREANTLGSKSAAIEMTDAAVALKLSIDQMREQLQNIE